LAGNIEPNFLSTYTTNNDNSIENTASLCRLVTALFMPLGLGFFFTLDFEFGSLANNRHRTLAPPDNFGREKFNTAARTRTRPSDENLKKDNRILTCFPQAWCPWWQAQDDPGSPCRCRHELR
jgi:hypothetical protein